MFIEFITEKHTLAETTCSRVDKYIRQYAELWEECRTDFPGIDIVYTKREKKNCEKDIEKFFDSVGKEVRKKNGLKNISNDFIKKCSAAVHGFLKDRLDFRENELQILFCDSFINVSCEFIRMANSFDSSLKETDIFQALRNVWTMNWVQLVLSKPIKLTPSIFAYSMLYPYTDNFLDDISISSEKKMDFNKRLAGKLAGRRILPENRHEHIVYELVELIESEFEREEYPGVYESLLAIHTAQIKSLLLEEPGKISESDLLDISIEKGGTSVLADGYLIAGELTEEEERFLFGYGAYLQIIDDMQDVIDDRKTDFNTIFSRGKDSLTLQEAANRLFYFGDAVMDQCNTFRLKNVLSIINLMKRTNELLIISGVGLAGECYNIDYVRKMEQYSSFSYSFLRERQKSFFKMGLLG